ncbi:MAG TPA: hypothetical protein VNA16_00325 [Abditibacteriaceae bacterium]|nr:hypothetical protein [Abditibacteriaceae bacterium]
MKVPRAAARTFAICDQNATRGVLRAWRSLSCTLPAPPVGQAVLIVPEW